MRLNLLKSSLCLTRILELTESNLYDCPEDKEVPDVVIPSVNKIFDLFTLFFSLQFSLSSPLPRLIINKRPVSIFDYTYESFEFIDYVHDAPIKAPVAI